MKKLLSLTVIIFVILGCYAQKSIDKAHFNKLIETRDYNKLLLDAHTERNKVYGKIWIVDYYIAKATCGLGKQKNAIEWFNSSLKYPNVNDEIRKFLLAEMGSCSSGQTRPTRTVTAIGMPDKSLLSPNNIPTSTSRGKMGSVTNCKRPAQEVTIVRNISSKEYESRLFNIDQGNEAILKYKTILKNNYQFAVSGRFLLITYGNKALNKEQIETTSKRLERTYTYFSSHFNLRPPDKLLAVYLLPDKTILRQTALLVHGVKIPDANIGYSNLSDLSLVGISDISQIGTLCHELFHLMIRTDIGDVPPWMDEGIACIYETSTWNGDELSGDIENWRADVLRNARWGMRDKIPTLQDFLHFNWHQYDGIETNDICRGAINYAYGKHLMLYCQQQGKLAELVTAVKNRRNSDDENLPVFKSDIEIFEDVFQMDIETFENQFNSWMKSEYDIVLISG
jgi:hypothetical protein